MCRFFALPLVAVALCSPSLLAQNRIAISGAPGLSSPAHGGFVPTGRTSIGISGIPFGDGMQRRPFRHSPFFYGAPYFYSDYEPYEPEYRTPPPAPQPAPAVQVKPEPLPDPVLLELRGNQW